MPIRSGFQITLTLSSHVYACWIYVRREVVVVCASFTLSLRIRCCQVVRYLLEKGANHTVLDDYGDTPLGQAILYMYVTCFPSTWGRPVSIRQSCAFRISTPWRLCV